MLQLSAFARDAGFQIAWSIARRMGVIPRPGFELAFQAQVQREVGDAPDSLGRVNNNPLNLTAPTASYWQGQTGWASGGSATEHHSDFAVFAALKDGIEAAAQNYMAGTYDGVRAAIAAGSDAPLLALEIARSPWDAGHYPQLADQVRQLEQATAAAAPPPATDAQASFDLIAPILQATIVAPQFDTDSAIKQMLAHQAAAIAEIASALARSGDHVSDAEIARLVTIIGLGLEKFGADIAAKGGGPNAA